MDEIYWRSAPYLTGLNAKPIVCFENPVLCTGSQKETLALSCFLLVRLPELALVSARELGQVV